MVGEASRGEEALAHLEEYSADVVLLDMKLPGIDGVETVRQMKQRRPEIKIIIFSGFGSEYITQAIEAGANGYLLKTASPVELVEAIHQAARGESPIDPQLAPALLDRFAHLSHMTQNQGLSRRQYEILRLVAGGAPSKAIAAQIAISDATLKREIRAIFDHMGVNDRAHAVAEGYRRHLL
ncbi:MAG: response regulator transcription factor [Dehalococcoidia bacterium]|nr:response regulator transcription factor [Dehalococcoidia bacterium]